MTIEYPDEPVTITAELAKPLVVLVDRFFDDTSAKQIKKALGEGPAALGRLCFLWSAAVVREEEALETLTKVQRHLPPSLRFMRQVRLLATVIDNAIREAYGEPVGPDIPALPADVECLRIGKPEELVDVQCPKRRPSRAHFLCTVEWAWSPVHDRRDLYYLSSNKPRSHWILWRGWPALVDFSYQAHFEYAPEVYCRRPQVEMKDAAFFLLRTFWRDEARSGTDRFHMIYRSGLLTADEITALADQCWRVEIKFSES